MNTKYIAVDCSGSALQFTGSGRSVQCDRADADQFDTVEAAQSALKRAEEKGGSVEEVA